MKRILTLAILALMTLPQSAFAQKADDIIGTWWTFHDGKKSGQVEVFKKNGKYYGRVVWVADNKNPDGSSPKLDYNNPEESLRKRVVDGLMVLKGLKWDSDDKEWEDGEIYDTKSGNTYDCYARLNEDGTLYFKGYLLGMRFIGRSTNWVRVKPHELKKKKK